MRMGLLALVLVATACGAAEEAGDGGTGGSGRGGSGQGGSGQGGSGQGGSGQGGSGQGGGATLERLLPLAIGASWTYRVTDTGTGEVGTKQNVVEALEDVGGAKAGVTAFRVRTSKPSGKSTVSWQEDTGSAIVRHREQERDVDAVVTLDEHFVPGKLRVDEAPAHLTLGARWDERYSEVAHDPAGGADVTVEKTDRWTVESIDDAVTVPAGSFACVRLRREGQTTASDKTYWFARGVGKVKEVGGGQTEELASYARP